MARNDRQWTWTVALALALVLGSGCGGSDGGGGSSPRLFGSTARFAADPAESTGSLFALDPASGEVDPAATPSADVDSIVDRAGDVPLVLSRTDGVVRIQDRADPLTTVRTVDVNPPGSPAGTAFAANPQAVVELGDGRAYVVPLSRNELVAIEPGEGGAEAPVGTVDLSPLAAPGDMDGVVDPSDAVRVGDRVYVTVARSWFDVMTYEIRFEGSLLAQVDPATDALVDADPGTPGIQGIPLAAGISGTGLVVDSDAAALYVVEVGAFGLLDGGIERVDLNAGEANGLVLTEADLGRDVHALGWVDPTLAYVLTEPEYDAMFTEIAPSEVRVWNPTTGALAPAPLAAGVDGMLVAGGALYLWSDGTVEQRDAATGDVLSTYDVSDVPIASMVRLP